jgi:hypothetical protein
MIARNMTGGAIMRTKWVFSVAIAGACAAMIAPAGLASAETAQEVINDLQSKGYTVTIDKIGTAPISECTVTSVRNPQNVTQLVPYVGPGLGGNDNRLLVPATVSQTISVSLNCSR